MTRTTLRLLYEMVKRDKWFFGLEWAAILSIWPSRIYHHLGTLEEFGLVERRYDDPEANAVGALPRPQYRARVVKRASLSASEGRT